VEAIQEHATNRRRGPHRGEYEIINEILNIVSYSDSISSPEQKRCKPIDIVYGCCLTLASISAVPKSIDGIESVKFYTDRRTSILRNNG
jgi:hypothetical protein